MEYLLDVDYACHLTNIGRSNAISGSGQIRRYRAALQDMCTFLRKRRVRQRTPRVCPSLMSMRWCDDSITLLFIVQNFQTVLCWGLDVPEEIFAYEMMLKPPYGSITTFEDRRSCFYMRVVMLWPVNLSVFCLTRWFLRVYLVRLLEAEKMIAVIGMILIDQISCATHCRSGVPVKW
jgi:hypothetical protein